MTRCRSLWISFLVMLLPGLVHAEAGQGEKSLNKLLEGNKRYVSGRLARKDLGSARRDTLAKGQKPSAIVLSCSDSRVPPELLFDQGLGDIFVVRVAGNVVDAVALGSIEYGAEHLHAPLLFILGHTKCGAVTATLESKGKAEGNIGAIVKKIRPAADRATKKGGTPEQVLDGAIHENLISAYQDLTTKSKIVPHLLEKGELKIVAGVYDIASGKVTLTDLPAEKSGKKKAH